MAGPVTWIHTGSANANFFFAITLTYCLSQIFLLLDVSHSYITHQYDINEITINNYKFYIIVLY